MKTVTGHLAEKNNKWYAIVNLPPKANGKRNEKWVNLKLEAKKGNKTEAKKRLAEVLAQYNAETSYLKEKLSPAEAEHRRYAKASADVYLTEWLEDHKHNIAVTTYVGYKQMMNSKIVAYFRDLGLPLSEITGEELNDFYSELRDRGLSGATAQRYHSLLHLAFKAAVKRGIIPANPCDQADRPKSISYIPTYYNKEELKALLDCLGDDPLRMVVILAAHYGLRRSEVVGLKWDAIDFTENTISIRHKIIENKLEGRRLEGLDVMKNKSSYRSLPLISAVKEELLAEKARQEERRKVLRGAYNKEYADYICVDAMGNLLKLQYVTEHFKVLLRKNGMKKIRFHDLRHSCASLLVANGVEMKLIQDWLGHSDMGTTANIYSHVDSASKARTAAVIGNVLRQ